MSAQGPWYDSRSTDKIIASILAQPDRASESYDDDTYWSNIGVLGHRVTRDVFEAGVRLCRSTCPVEQRLGCDLLSRLGDPDHPFRDESFEPVHSVLEKATDRETAVCALAGLGRLKDPRALPVLLGYLRHLDDEVRFIVAWALPSYSEEGDVGPALIELSTDWDIDVRDWATLGLALMTDRDTPAIRDALLARTEDSVASVRAEALRGLAERHDPRTFALLAREFERPFVNEVAFDAAEALADPRCLPLLVTARERFGDWPALDGAIERLKSA